MTDDVSGRWLTYVQLAQLLGSTPSGAHMYARRRGWERRTANAIGKPTRVLMPADTAVPQRTAHSAALISEQSPGTAAQAIHDANGEEEERAANAEAV